jgi:GntR family transcriptional regulator, histidine utilization repressor
MRASAAPVDAHYLRVKKFVTAQIASGVLTAGARVPSENELVRKFKLARMTVNRALRELAEEGVLERVAGSGTFVAEQRVHAHPLEVHSIAEEIRARGHEYRARVVTLESVAAPAEVAERCGVRTGAKLDHSVVVHYESASPLQVEDRYVNPAVIPGYRKNDFTQITPHDYLMRVAPLQRAEHTVRAVTPDARIRRLLQLSAAEACLLILRRTWSHDRIATVATLHHPGTRYELTGAFRAGA